MKGLRALCNQRGMSLVTAIFILVVLAAIGGYMVLVAGVQSRTTVMALQGARAYHAARSGLEWGINRDLNSGVCVSDSFQLDGYTVTVTCEPTAFNEGAELYRVSHKLVGRMGQLW